MRGVLRLARHDFRGALTRRPAGAHAGARTRQAVRRGRRRQRRAGALRRRRRGAPADDRPEAQPRRLRARLVLPRAARRPARRARSAHPRGGRGRRGGRERLLRAARCRATSSLRAAGTARHAPPIATRSPASPRYVPARAGLARVDAASGRLPSAITRLRSRRARLPLPEYVVLLGETELAAGRATAARRTFDLVRVQERLLAGAGVDTDVELALFEADHGDPRRGLSLARAAWRSAPSVRSADALGWALTRAGRPREGLRWGRRALRLGSRDARFLYHAGMSAVAAGGSAPRPLACCAVRCVPTAVLGAVRAAGAPRAAGTRVSRRAAFAAFALLLVMLLAPAAAQAHPLGNFTVNRLAVVGVSGRSRRRPLDPRPGRDPDLPGTRPARRRSCSRSSASRRCADCDCASTAPPSRCAPRRRARSRFPRVRAGCARRASSCC